MRELCRIALCHGPVRMPGRWPRTHATLEPAPAALSPVASSRRVPPARAYTLTPCTRPALVRIPVQLDQILIDQIWHISTLSKQVCSAGVWARVLCKVPPAKAAACTRVQGTSAAHVARNPADQGSQGWTSLTTASPSGANSQPAPVSATCAKALLPHPDLLLICSPTLL